MKKRFNKTKFKQLLNESALDVNSHPALGVIFETAGTNYEYLVGRAEEAIKSARCSDLPDEQLKLAISLLALARYAWTQ